MNSQLQGGKTAPRLLEDLHLYDPSRPSPTGYNILTEPPPQYEEDKPQPPKLISGGCRHTWFLKPNQCRLPEYEALESTLYVVSAFCAGCRSHLEFSVDFRGAEPESASCPTEERPLHHFMYNYGLSESYSVESAWWSVPPVEWEDVQRFQCSSPYCSAKLTIRFRPPRLTPAWVSLLTDPDIIKARATKAISEDPERLEGIAIPSPVDVLMNLRHYIFNALNLKEKRVIPGNNKKWVVCFGESCFEFLEHLGFSRQGEDWLPPSPDVAAETPFKNPLNILLDDVEKELFVLKSGRSVLEQRTNSAQFTPISAESELQKVLGCFNCENPILIKKKLSFAHAADQGLDQRSIKSRIMDPREEHPFYAALGATSDFHDDLITFCYDRQIDVDSHAAAYYLECLQGLGEGRKSEALQTHAAIEASKGKISLKDIKRAYQDLGFSNDSTARLDDDTIIGTFQARVSSSPKQEAELRRALKIIGQHRWSSKIQSIAANVVTNYEQALTWLGATEDMSDDFVISMYHVKVQDCPADEDKAREAVKLISDHRKSSALQSWLETGVLGEIEMDVGRAYNRLGISDRMLDDETILTAFNYHVSEAPSQTEDLRSALTAIAKSKNSKLLQGFLNSGMVSSEHPLAEWPVGLENIGNTCYLNSLLQFLFTVKPLRTLVLEFDKYKMQIDDVNLRKKRVGSRKVSRKEIERAQRFVYELQKLFQSMITANQAHVTPEQELARLTLISSTTEEHIRRQSVLSGHRPSLGEIGGRPVLGPLLPSGSMSAGSDHDMESLVKPEEIDKQDVPVAVDLDGGSDVTLVEPFTNDDSDLIMLDTENNVQQHQILEDKENLAPSKSLVAIPVMAEKPPQPLFEASPSRSNGIEMLLNPVEEEKQSRDTASGPINAQPPNRPPPFPPRPKPEEPKNSILEEVEIGAQQDVTEVIQNVLFQLQCAIEAEAADENGEQLDLIKHLFFGKQKSYTTDREGLIRTKEEYFSDIKVDVASGPRDIYAALDAAYDVQEVEVAGNFEPQYTSISQLPPVLQIHVQRAQFDQEKKSSFKSNHHLELKETLYMDRYMDSADADILERRRECWDWKKRVAECEARKSELSETEFNMSVSDFLISTHAYLQQVAGTIFQDNDPVDVSDQLLQEIGSASQHVMEELEAIDLEIKTLNTNINSQFNDLRSVPYRLHSVFIHRGYVSSGHYWIFIYDFANEIWRNYNDGYVTAVKDNREIFDRDSETRPSTPYFLVYIKDDLKETLVNPVCRNIMDPPKNPQDAEMLDIGDRSSYDFIDPLNTDATKFNHLNLGGMAKSTTAWDSSAISGDNW